MIVKSELDYLFEDWFDELFNDILDDFVSNSRESLSIAAVYAITRNLKSNGIQSNFKITRDFSNFKNIAFYKLGLNFKTPPIRIIFKNFED